MFRHKIIDTYQNVVHKVSEAFDGNKKSKSTYLVDDVRDDVVEESIPLEDALKNCDQVDDREIEVPKVVG